MLRLVKKDIRLFLKDRKAMILTFLLPVLLITLFALAFGGVGGSKKSKEYALPVSDLDGTPASKNAVVELDSNKNISVVPMPLADAQEAVKNGDEDCVLIFHKGFADSLKSGSPLPVELQYDEASEMKVGMLQQALFSTLAMLPYREGNMSLMMSRQFDRMLGNSSATRKSEVHNQFDTLYRTIQLGMEERTDTAEVQGFSMGPEIRMTKLVAAKEENSLGLVHAVSGTAIMMLLFSVAGMGASLLDEKAEGTLKKLLYSPLPPRDILFSKVISTNLVCIAQLTIMFIYANLVLGLELKPHIPSLLLMIPATAWACSSFGVFLASFSKSRQQVSSLATLIVLVMSCIGGSMVPLFVMPEFIQKIAIVSVNYWGVQGFYDIFWRMLPITAPVFLMKVGVLLMIGLVLNSLALRLYRKNILHLA